MPRTEGMKFNAHEPDGKPACPLVEVAKHQPWAVQMGLQQYLAVHQLARLIAALHVICAEVHVEELNQPAHPSRTRRGDEGKMYCLRQSCCKRTSSSKRTETL